MSEESLFCRINVSPDNLRVSGLQKRWPAKVRRSLDPLDFKQESDVQLQGLVAVFQDEPGVPQVLHLDFLPRRSIDRTI